MPDKQESKPQNGWLKWGAAAAFLLAKGKSLISVLKLGKIFGPVLSMAVSIWAYALIYPWAFSVGFVALLLVHEMGHVLAARRKGLPVSAPLFLPFVGALITLKRHPQDARTEAYLAFGGPLLGTIGATAVFAAAYLTDSPLLYSLAYVGFFLNLINLLPIHPLDGGRIATAVTRWLWLAGLVGGLYLIVFHLRSVLFFIIWAMFAYDLYQKFVKRKKNMRDNDLVEETAHLLPLQPLIDAGQPVPGPEHTRELSFTTYSTVEERQQIVVMRWESIGFETKVALPVQGMVHHARLVRAERLELDSGPHLRLYCQVQYSEFENAHYYEVPRASRWRFGLGYAGLASYLAGMMYLVHVIGNIGV